MGGLDDYLSQPETTEEDLRELVTAFANLSYLREKNPPVDENRSSIRQRDVIRKRELKLIKAILNQNPGSISDKTLRKLAARVNTLLDEA